MSWQNEEAADPLEASPTSSVDLGDDIDNEFSPITFPVPQELPREMAFGGTQGVPQATFP